MFNVREKERQVEIPLSVSIDFDQHNGSKKTYWPDPQNSIEAQVSTEETNCSYIASDSPKTDQHSTLFATLLDNNGEKVQTSFSPVTSAHLLHAG